MWSLHYCLLVFLAVLGVLQLAAVHNDLKGLLLFPGRKSSVIFAALAISFALFAFFTWNDYRAFIVEGVVAEGIVEGSQQTGSFVVSSAVAIVFTLAASSALNHRRLNGGKSPRDGLDVLRESTFFQAVRNHRSKEGR